METAPFTEPTTEYWQEILPTSEATSAPWQYGYPARLPDSRILKLPIRALNANEAVASLIINQYVSLSQSSQLLRFYSLLLIPRRVESRHANIMTRAAIDVTAKLGAFLADVVRPFNPDVIVGLPTLGLSLAPIIAQSLGHSKSSHYFLVP